jgi:hypothetical protein
MNSFNRHVGLKHVLGLERKAMVRVIQFCSKIVAGRYSCEYRMRSKSVPYSEGKTAAQTTTTLYVV